MVYLTGTTLHPRAKNLGVIHIHYLPITFTCKAYDALVLTSKNAVNALELSGLDWKELPCFVIGQATADAVIGAGGIVEFVASEAYGDILAKEVTPLLKNKHIAIVRPKEVVTDVTSVLRQSGVDVDDFIGYETRCVAQERLEKPSSGSAIIFTSPSTVACFLKCFSWDSSWKAVCIGHKTAAVIPSSFISYIAPEQSVDACVDMAYKLYENLSKSSL